MSDEKTSDLLAYASSNTESFSDRPFHNADALILSELAYIKWENLDGDDAGIGYPDGGSLTLKEAIERLDPNYTASLSADFQELLIALKDNPRFNDMVLSNYCVRTTEMSENIKEHVELEQFSAIVFSYRDEHGENRNFISHRGTDGSLEGWCEDFNMAYDNMTEAQKSAVEYTNTVISSMEGEFDFGGHSKGGNHAMYAYLFCDESLRDRISKVYNFDGPGFIDDLCYIDDEGNITKLDPNRYQQLLNALDGSAVCPYDSIIGQLLNEHDFIFVDTDEHILLDHDAFSWKLDPETGEFVRKEQSDVSKYLDETLDEWLFSLPEEYRKSFMTGVWGWIYSLGGNRLEDIGDAFKSAPFTTANSFFNYIANLPEEQRNQWILGLCTLGIYAIDNYLEAELPGFSTLKNKFSEILAERNISTPEDIWLYIKEDPVVNTMDLMQSFLMDWDVLKALVSATTSVVLATYLMKLLKHIVVYVLKWLLSFVVSHLAVIAIVVACVIVVALVINFIKDHWDEIVSTLQNCKEYVQEKIAEFVQAMELAVRAGVHAAIAGLVYRAEQIAEMYLKAGDAVVDLIHRIGEYASRALQEIFRVYHPLLYSAIRTITGLVQEPVTIDMTRLQNAVDQMDRLARRVQTIDNRLDFLYGRLCVSNIEQGEGVFTSLVDMYHLSKADINVDQGNKIRRKAEAISELFQDYKETERWVLAQIGG